jgi:2-oxoglutarate dehydrogenase E2 component (dihydrolipoamide succinyltransferase)
VQANSQAAQLHASPLARKIMDEKKVNSLDITTAFPGKRITRKDIELFINRKKEAATLSFTGTRDEDRKKMTTLRLKLAERLVSVKNQTAMLTTFNEINMQAALKIKEKYNDSFKEKYGVGFGLMSIFTKAVTIALREFPQVNSMIDGDDLVTPRYVDIGIAVSAPKGLVVPVLRNAESMSMAEIELRIKELAGKARDNKISIDDMKGGTFTITNGGVFGSLMSTPILNPPQSAILGMHKIQDRPIAVNGQVVIAPMMYVALSYDHRVIDGRESVNFLVKVKELIEDPAKMLTDGQDPIKLLLDL